MGTPPKNIRRNNYGEEKVSQWGYTRKGGVFGLGENEDEIFHKMTTLPGQSGCPIIEIGPKRSLSIVGIHKGGKKCRNSRPKNEGQHRQAHHRPTHRNTGTKSQRGQSPNVQD
jgi:hypothetical protein